MITLLIALAMPPTFIVDDIESATVRGKKPCLWRGERLTCIVATHKTSVYSIATREDGSVRYILTIRGGRIVEVWTHDSKEA